MEIIKVLIIEDQDSYIEVIKRATSNREIILAQTITEAIEVLEKNEFDLITVGNSKEVLLSMTAEQKQKTIVYTKQNGSLTASAKASLRAVMKNHVGFLELAIGVA